MEIEGVGYAFHMDAHKGKLEQTLFDIEQHEVEIRRILRERNTVAYAKEAARQKEVFLGLIP